MTVVATALLVLASGCGTRQSREAVEAAAAGSPQAGGASGVAIGAGGTANSGGATGAVGAAGGAVGDPGAAPADGATTDPADAGGGAGPAEAGPAAAAANGTPIVIGNVSTTSGIAGGPQAPGVRGMQAWVALTNAAGGINGHPIELIVADDGGDPARHAAAVQDLVENRGVIAFVSNWASQTVQASRPFIEANRIPVIGGDSSANAWFESPMLFPIGPTPANYMRARLATLAAITDLRRIGSVVCREGSICSEMAAALRRHAAEFGFEVVYDGQASVAQPDFTAECLSARNAGAEILMPTFDAASQRRIAQSCSRQGYNPLYAFAGAIEPDFAEIAAFDGAIISNPAFPPQADDPRAAAFREALETYAPNQPPLPIAASGWAAGMLFGQLATAAFPPDATPNTEALLDALWSLENDTVGGLLGPLTYRRDQPHAPTAPTCVFLFRVQEGAFVATQGMEPACV